MYLPGNADDLKRHLGFVAVKLEALAHGVLRRSPEKFFRQGIRNDCHRVGAFDFTGIKTAAGNHFHVGSNQEILVGGLHVRVLVSARARGGAIASHSLHADAFNLIRKFFAYLVQDFRGQVLVVALTVRNSRAGIAIPGHVLVIFVRLLGRAAVIFRARLSLISLVFCDVFLGIDREVHILTSQGTQRVGDRAGHPAGNGENRHH